jgi:hypothetical protein
VFLVLGHRNFSAQSITPQEPPHSIVLVSLTSDSAEESQISREPQLLHFYFKLELRYQAWGVRILPYHVDGLRRTRPAPMVYSDSGGILIVSFRSEGSFKLLS